VDLTGLQLPEPETLKRFQFAGGFFSKIKPAAEIRNVKWENLDFTGSKLKSLRLFSCRLTNCRFDRCQMEDLRVWDTTFKDCSFRGANLRDSALGPGMDSKRNIYLNVDFTETDLRGTNYNVALFEGCFFRNAKIKGIDFQTSAFVDCIFEGELNDVLFYSRGYEGEKYPANEMINVDFSRATLRYVGFRGLTLDKVRFPKDENHLVFRDVVGTLNRLIETLKRQGDEVAEQLVRYLDIDRKHISPNQAQAVINLQDLADTFGSEAVARLRDLLG
jgi:uncharacterized protein YjbI with pentapeptide repeats